MTTYAVIRKSDQVEVYRYQAEAPVEWGGLEFADYDHIEVPAEAAQPANPPPEIVWSPIDFLRRFTAQERIAARAARKTDPILDDFYALLEQATEVRNDNADVAMGLGYMTLKGLLAPGRMQEIMHG